MSIRKIKVQKLTREAFAPYGTVVDWPSEQEADRFALRSSDRFDFFPKLGSLACDHDSLGQIALTYAYRLAPAGEVSIYNYSGILFSMVLGFLCLGETIPVTSFLGGALVIAASLLVYVYSRRQEKKQA